MIQCYPDNLATFANDVINFDKIIDKRRSLTKTFYTKHKNTNITAIIDTNDVTLVAKETIKENEEIFIHYGFQYWFMTEARLGFLPEFEKPEYDLDKIPLNIKTNKLYINIFYPKSKVIEEKECFGISYENGSGVLIPYVDIGMKKIKSMI
jgi:hypothetical protein